MSQTNLHKKVLNVNLSQPNALTIQKAVDKKQQHSDPNASMQIK